MGEIPMNNNPKCLPFLSAMFRIFDVQILGTDTDPYQWITDPHPDFLQRLSRCQQEFLKDMYLVLVQVTKLQKSKLFLICLFFDRSRIGKLKNLRLRIRNTALMAILMFLDSYRYWDREISCEMFQTNFRKIKAVSETCCLCNFDNKKIQPVAE